jgi:alpha-tubulin suppressor-like RCC1 family protein
MPKLSGNFKISGNGFIRKLIVIPPNLLESSFSSNVASSFILNPSLVTLEIANSSFSSTTSGFDSLQGPVLETNSSFSSTTSGAENVGQPDLVDDGVMEEEWIQISSFSSGRHVLALDSQGRAWAWGDNFYGQLGNNRLTAGDVNSYDLGIDSNVPVLVTIPEGHPGTWRHISAGQFHSIGIDSNGKGWAWGRNVGGCLGIAQGDTSNRFIPTAIDTTLVQTWSQLSAGGFHSLGISLTPNPNEGYAWGNNTNWGNLGVGVGDTTNRNIPTAIDTTVVQTWKQLSAGDQYSLGIALVPSADRGYGWGNNASGRLGTGNTTTFNVPTDISRGLVSTWKQLSAGNQHSLGIALAPNINKGYAWGNNTNGRLGDNSNTVRTSPVAIVVFDVQTWSQLSAGSEHSLGIALSPNEGKGYAWGTGGSGRLGTGFISNISFPSAITTADGRPQTWAQLTGLAEQSLGISADEDNDGQAWAWGRNNLGQLGDGTTNDVNDGPKSIGLPPPPNP